MKEQTQPPGYLSPFQDQAFQTSTEPWTRSSSAHPSSSNHTLYLFFLIIPLPDCQVVGTALLLFAISAINNPANSAVSSRWLQLYSLLSLDDFDSGVICDLRQLGHLFATLFFFPLSLGPLLVGLVVVNIGICFGHNAG